MWDILVSHVETRELKSGIRFGRLEHPEKIMPLNDQSVHEPKKIQDSQSSYTHQIGPLYLVAVDNRLRSRKASPPVPPGGDGDSST